MGDKGVMDHDLLKEYRFLKELEELSYVHEIWLFGSRARNAHHDRSDIDLAINLTENLSNYKVEISKILSKADTLLKVDVTYLNDKLDPEFITLINKDKKRLY